jgi:hypothetical protein
MSAHKQRNKNSQSVACPTKQEVAQMLEKEQAEAQQALDELFSEHLIPFNLSAQVIESIGGDEYIVRFHDSRLHSVDVSCPQGQSFKEAFRAAVLERVKRLSGPLHAKTTEDKTAT